MVLYHSMILKYSNDKYTHLPHKGGSLYLSSALEIEGL